MEKPHRPLFEDMRGTLNGVYLAYKVHGAVMYSLRHVTAKGAIASIPRFNEKPLYLIRVKRKR